MSAPPGGPKSSVLNFNDVLQGAREFRVPLYQRAYAWTEAEVGQLLEDLFEAVAVDASYYFMGSIVLIREDRESAEIVDGQQRLATFMLVCAALGERLAGRELSDRLGRLVLHAAGGAPRVRLRPNDQATFAMAVQAPEDAARKPITEALSDPEAAILRATRTIAEGLSDFSGDDPERLERFAEFVLSRALFNVLETDDRAGAPRLFLVINDTGADLSAADLVKAALFERAHMSEADAEEAAQRWDELLAEMGRKGFDELLAFMPSIVSGAALTFHPSKFGVLRAGLLDHVDPVRFLKEDIHRYADALLALRRAEVDAGEASREVNRRVRCLHLLKARHWIGAAVAKIAEHNGPKELLLPFFEGLERLGYACALGIIKTHRQTERFAEVLRARREPHKLFGPGGALELTPDQKSQFIGRLNRPFDREYALRRMIVMRANAALEGGEALLLTDDATVEHILPTGRSEVWERLFPDRHVRRQLAHMLGNFTLTMNAQNRAADRKPYADKRAIYFNWKGAPVRALTRTLRDIPEWTTEQVIARHEMIVDALAADWRLLD